jgi:hypothetical protein
MAIEYRQLFEFIADQPQAYLNLSLLTWFAVRHRGLWPCLSFKSPQKLPFYF